MREILFRGKSKSSGKLIISGSIQQTNYSGTYLWFEGGWHEIVPETLGQYAGLKDKNGTMIFEGDIIKSKYPDCTAVVEWQENTCRFLAIVTSKKSPTSCDFLYIDKGENGNGISNNKVIGNIHDNSELLKGE